MPASQWLKIAQYCLLPGSCVVCRKPSRLPRDLCAPCLAAFTRIERPCRSCGLPLPPGTPKFEPEPPDSPESGLRATGPDLCGACLGCDRRFVRSVAAFAYTEPLSTLIAGFKYRAGLPQGRVLGDLLLRDLQAHYAGAPLPQLLLPVPLHPARLRERGFNQALVLARQLGAALQIPVAAEALMRTRCTPAQQGLSARQRKHNLRGAFALKADVGRYTTVALVDDVVTTMSTMHEVARVLRRAHPALELHAWSLARA